jgi:hypothetical protein
MRLLVLLTFAALGFAADVAVMAGTQAYVSAGHEPAIREPASNRVDVAVGERGEDIIRRHCTNQLIQIGHYLCAFPGVVFASTSSEAEIVRMLQYCPGMAMHELVSGIMSAATAAGETDDRAVIAVRVSESRERARRASDFVLAGSSVNPLIAA